MTNDYSQNEKDPIHSTGKFFLIFLKNKKLSLKFQKQKHTQIDDRKTVIHHATCDFLLKKSIQKFKRQQQQQVIISSLLMMIMIDRWFLCLRFVN